MSRENVEIVKSLYDALGRRDNELPFEIYDEDIVWDMSGAGIPDLGKVYRGHEGVREFWRGWLPAWETIAFTTLYFADHGDHVIVECEQQNRGRSGGVVVDFHWFQVWTLRNGKVTASRWAATEAEALEAVGLSE